MKVLFISMPDVVPILVHETAVHIPNIGIASIGGNIDPEHTVFLVDLICKCRSVKKYLTKVIGKIKPDIIGLSAMVWQYYTCIKIAYLIKELRPEVKIMSFLRRSELMRHIVRLLNLIQKLGCGIILWLRA